MALAHTEVTDGVAVVTLDDPERRNALNGQMVDEIVEPFDALEADDDGAVRWWSPGAPPAFCAGADLGHLGSSRRARPARHLRGVPAGGAGRPCPPWPRSTAPPWGPA